MNLKQRSFLLAFAGLIVAGMAGYFLAFDQPVKIWVDNQPSTVMTRAHRVGEVLASAGLRLRPGDRLDPPPGRFFLAPPEIHLERAAPIQIWNADKNYSLTTAERNPEKILQQVGLKLNPQEELWEDGQPARLDQPLAPGLGHVLEIRRRLTLHLNLNGSPKEIVTSAATLGEALWTAGIFWEPEDRLSLPAETPLTRDTTVSLTRAGQLTIRLGKGEIRVRSAARTVSEALAEAGLALQGLDYSVPAEDQAVPADGQIRVVRVSEAINTTQKLLPYQKEYQKDANTELDHTSVVKPGQMGIILSRERVRYEDGQQVSQVQEAEWKVQDPVSEVVGRGTKVVLHTEVVNGVSIQYWRKVTVYATSYSPCRSAASKCMNGTSSGLPVRRGVVAVSWTWYRDMAGQQIFVPGYGKAVIGDTGGGIPGEYWIDLAFTDADFEPWHQWVTVYFLAPAPKTVPYILYP